MSKKRKFRGSGVRHTLPFMGRYAGLWVMVTLLAVAAAAVSTYLVFVERDGTGIATALIVQTVLTGLAVVALGVFTTHRLAGPWIAVRRALDRVRGGDLTTELRIRSNDSHMRDVERAFNDMVATLREQSSHRRSA
jgi:methyl-accepting chemotaxis protein